MNTNMIKFGTLHFYGNSRMPIVEIIDSTTEEVLGYLSPFRGYCFQISGTLDGVGDLGSSQVIGLGNIWGAIRPDFNKLSSSNLGWDSTKKELLQGQAALALMHFSRSHKAVFDYGKFGKVHLSNDEEIWVNSDLDEFIEEVAIWLKNQLGF